MATAKTPLKAPAKAPAKAAAGAASSAEPKSKKPAEDSAPANTLGLFSAALALLNSATDAPEYVVLTASKTGNYCTVAAEKESSAASVRLPFPVPGMTPGTSVRCTMKQLTASLRGRVNGAVSVSDNNLTIKAGSYSARLPVEEANPIPAPRPTDAEGAQVIQMTPDLLTFLQKRVPLLQIEKYLPALPDTLLHISLSPKERFLISYDSLQVAYMRGTPEKGDPDLRLKVTLPYTKFASLIKDLPSPDCEMYVTTDSLVIVGGFFSIRVLLPLFQEGMLRTPEQIKQWLTAAANEVSGTSLVFEENDLKAFMENTRELIQPGTTVDFRALSSGKGVRVKVHGHFGEAFLTLKGATVQQDFSVDARFVQTLLAKIGANSSARAKANDDVKGVAIDLISKGKAFRLTGLVSYVAAVAAEAAEDSAG